MAELTIQQTFDLALQHHQARRLPEAERLYRQVLAQQPTHIDALQNLGAIALQTGRNEAAIGLLRQVIALRPDFPEAHSNLGTALKNQGQLDQAIASYRQAVALRPNFCEAHNNLGIALNLNGQFDEAIAAHRRAIDLKPTYAEAHGNLGIALKNKGQIDEAIDAYRQVIALDPGNAIAYSNLGIALKNKGQIDDAIAAYRQAIVLRPEYPEAENNLGNVLKDKGQLDRAIAAFRQAIALRPNFPEAHNNLGNALNDNSQPDEAIAAFRQAIAQKPDYAEAWCNLGNSLHDTGRVEEAVAAYRQAILIRPDLSGVYGNLILVLHYDPAQGARAIAEECRIWNRRYAEPLRVFIQSHSNDRSPDRPLRIGYVSPDFRDHAVGRNLLPLFQHHDRRQFEITCYARVLRPDAMTGQFQRNCNRWRDIGHLSDELAAKQIREDGIDILVDLALHSANNRLLIFARKPAPVQVTFAGYPGSTGLSTIDYRLSDPYLDPSDMDESVYSEKTIRLPNSFWCYDPMEYVDIPVNSQPALGAGVVTFGCLNNFCKVNDFVLALWARVLRQVAGSRLLLLVAPGSHRQRTVDKLHHEGIDPERVDFSPRQKRRKYLELFHRIDVGLDSFPYNGHTTSLEALWMGVPVVTLVGLTAVSRAGWCQLSNLGLSELAGQTPEQFVKIAAELAGDLPRLEELRSTLRRRMQQSPLMDAPRYARNIEEAYRQMWRNWCAEGGELGLQSAVE